MRSFDKKKIAVLSAMLVMILCVGAINHRLSVQEDLSVSAGYEDYELSQLEHDGEVLVDSINVTALPGESDGSGDSEQPASGDSQIVTSDNVAELENADTYFGEVRASVTMDRNEIISMLTEVINELPDGTEKNNATQQKLKIIDYMNKENEIESLIENKGFSEALVIITDTSVNISVKKQELSQADVAKIMDIAIRETGRKAEEIVIQSKF
ncbi:MAG: SpoIIIAH-like family protein [Firmicutes bacterium]|nr:SpoIIIAH-like family protein [Bacillota bacterium]